MKQKMLALMVLLGLSPWLLGMEGAGDPVFVIYTSTGNISSRARGISPKCEVVIEFTRDSVESFFDPYSYTSASPNVAGNFVFIDTLEYLFQIYPFYRIRVINGPDTIFSLPIPSDSVKHSETLGQHADCFSKQVPTTEYFSLPYQRISIP